ncbi:LYAR-type C2HC zinc finger protein [Aspergillus lucknowensis]|uniref:Zinc finger C2H2 LYAR-type domain-containing protein n=1 Tax=Aspergillus lucknowensis TaxID=176173 RepID=A0ABR4L918_9EURO
MVSFSCEACGDVLTKKKLDPHRNQCRGASFTCIDCMVHFQGTSYRSHTSCMSEAQKYEGALYKEKPTKNQRKDNNKKNDNKQPSKSNAKHRAPYVEDAPDSQVNLPPPAPSPPSPAEAKPAPAKDDTKVNVFDFLVDEKAPNASKVSIAQPEEQMKMVEHAPSVFEPGRALARIDTEDDDESKDYDVAYEENGFSYGSGPIIEAPVYPNKNASVSMEFMTPAPKKKKDRSRKERLQSPPTLSRTTSDKKRKRHVDDHDVEDADTPMLEAPSSVVNHPGTPILSHSGLTGGLDRMLRSPSIDDDEASDRPRRRYQDPSSPLKRTRRDEKDGHGDAGLGISIKSRAERLVSSMFAGSSVSGSSIAGNDIDVRKSRKGHKTRSGSNEQTGSSDALKAKRKISAQTEGDRPSRRLKQIDYPERSYSPRDDNGREMVVYRQENQPDEVQREMAAHFLSLVTKGPESSRGFSVNKVLKRFHRDFTDEFDGDDRGRGQGRSRADRERRIEDEKDLWRTLRVKQNERGEIVLFF